jgi:hypothetical protein
MTANFTSVASIILTKDPIDIGTSELSDDVTFVGEHVLAARV